MLTSSHIRSDIAADITARRVATAAGSVRRRRRAPLAGVAARLLPSAARRRTAQPVQ